MKSLPVSPSSIVPLHHGSDLCFRLTESIDGSGQEITILNLSLAGLKKALKRIPAEVRVVMCGPKHGLVVDRKVNRRHWRKHVCPKCCPKAFINLSFEQLLAAYEKDA